MDVQNMGFPKITCLMLRQFNFKFPYNSKNQSRLDQRLILVAVTTHINFWSKHNCFLELYGNLKLSWHSIKHVITSNM